MKLLIAIIQERDRRRVEEALSVEGFFFTKIASTGGFLRDGNVTMLLGVESEQLEQVLGVLRESSEARDQYVSLPPPDVMPSAGLMQAPVKVTVGGAVVFVMDVERFERW
ncbi:MAG: cyclic-di-AMP receptor [Armatimonadetes bacterium]|nr:cyclic-di-AMP receptor [Armatimonadota bacterium]